MWRRLVAHLLWEQRVVGSNPATRTIYESDIDMDTEYLKRQAIFRLIVFFIITVVVGFIASDINILMSQ